MISEAGEHCSTFELKIGAASTSDKNKKKAVKDAKEEEADEAFRKRMARMKKALLSFISPYPRLSRLHVQTS